VQVLLSYSSTYDSTPDDMMSVATVLQAYEVPDASYQVSLGMHSHP
jgi:hypothetical protein